MFWCSHNDLEKTKKWIPFEINQIPSDYWYRWAVILAESGELISTGLIYYEKEYNLFEVSYNSPILGPWICHRDNEGNS